MPWMSWKVVDNRTHTSSRHVHRHRCANLSQKKRTLNHSKNTPAPLHCILGPNLSLVCFCLRILHGDTSEEPITKQIFDRGSCNMEQILTLGTKYVPIPSVTEPPPCSNLLIWRRRATSHHEPPAGMESSDVQSAVLYRLRKAIPSSAET
jgi:hypothetical protein